MYIDRLLFPVTTLGPGNRLVIWTSGCSKHCVGCANPELWVCRKKGVLTESLSQIIHKINSETPIDGITFTGGDPLEQFDELCELLSLICDITGDILVYTGFDFEVFKKYADKAELKRFTKYAAVVIDGPYIESQNDNSSALIGSVNQNIIYLKPEYKNKYENYILRGREVQNVMFGSKVVSVGIHNNNKERLTDDNDKAEMAKRD